MAMYMYDADADALQILLRHEPDVLIARTEELSPTVHADLDADGNLVGVEFLYPRTHPIDTSLVAQTYGVELEIPFSFAA